MQRDGVRDYFPAASSIIIAFCLADAGDDIKSEKYVKPEGTDTSLVFSTRNITNDQIKRKPETSKDRESLLMIFG